MHPNVENVEINCNLYFFQWFLMEIGVHGEELNHAVAVQSPLPFKSNHVRIFLVKKCKIIL
jgi:hypothetical protein